MGASAAINYLVTTDANFCFVFQEWRQVGRSNYLLQFSENIYVNANLIAIKQSRVRTKYFSARFILQNLKIKI